MKKFIIWVGVVVFVIGLGVVTFWDVPQWRLYTQDWKPLAMTHAENYCTGKIGIGNRFIPNDPAVERCMKESGKDNVTPSIANSESWACEGVLDGGWDAPMQTCLDILRQAELWMLAGGGLASASSWSDTHPRPEAIHEGVLPDTRSNRGGDAVPSLDRQGE